VGIGKTVEAALIASELLATGEAKGLSVLCSPALAEQWQGELRDKFGLDAELVLTSTATRLQRGLGMNESLFQKYPITVVSTDFIKSRARRDEFVRAAPDLVIVDEAHTAVSDGSAQGGKSSRTKRHELMRLLAADPNRHLILVTATPHSGQAQGFDNLLELLSPDLPILDLNTIAGRERLATFFIQRRRADIRRYLDQDTPFPSDRETAERPYTLGEDYHRLFTKVLAYARERVQSEADGTTKQRVQWWSVLALLRALSSSPAAAAATLRKRAANAEALTEAEADELGRNSVLDSSDDEALEDIDATPGALTADEGDTTSPDRRRLLGFAREADALSGPAKDAKLAEVINVVKGLLADGFDPIVFCRFIDTAEYVGEHLAIALKKSARVGVVTGTLPPAERVARIAELTAEPGRVVLVATDCLSEGVNLQEAFQAVVHYDLAWNPTRHEQREGRVDRFGQKRDIVRAVTIYGKDNQIDGVVLEVLLRKHDAIRKATGVSVPVPTSSDSVVQALMEGLLLRGSDSEQLAFDIGKQAQDQLDKAWTSAAEVEKASRTKYAQAGIDPTEVATEVAAIRAALGAGSDIEEFVGNTVRALGGSITTRPDGLTAATGNLPPALRQSLSVGHHEPLPFHRQPPTMRKEALLARTDPDVGAIATFVLEAALDPAMVPAGVSSHLARRSGVFRSPAATKRTVVLLLRERVHLTLPGRDTTRTQVVEHAQTVAYTGSPDQPTWLEPADVAALLDTPASAIGADGLSRDTLSAAITGIAALTEDLNLFAMITADELRDSHRRVRKTSGDRLRGLAAEAILPPDVLGIYVYLPPATR
ncbi:MAG: helicase-related protein, partial [Actinomycetes bacterium]